MEIQEKLNIEARLAELEHFESAMLEAMESMNQNNHRISAILDNIAVGIAATGTLAQNLAILTIGEERYHELMSDESFTDEVIEAIEHMKRSFAESASNAGQRFIFERMMRSMVSKNPNDPE